jgi:hypothetical protein
MSHTVDISAAQESSSTKAPETGSLNTLISVAVAIGGTFMALCSVKEGNLSEGMAEAQSNIVNKWSYFQSKSTKQNLAESTLEQLRAMRALNGSAPAEALAELDKKTAAYLQKIERYENEKNEIKAEAEQWQKRYEDLDRQGDQFDLSDAAMSVGIALCGVAALVERRFLAFVAIAFLVAGVGFGMAGFLGKVIPIPFVAELLK